MTLDLAFFAASVPAIVLTGFAKGGFTGLGLLSLPLMALVVPPLQAAAIMLPLLVAQDAVTVWSYRREIDLFNLATLMPGALLGILLAYLLATRVSDAAVSLLLGLICAGAALRRLLARDKPDGPATRPGFVPGTFWGIISGFTSMIAHAGGPPFQIYVLPQRLPPGIFVGTGSLFFAMMNLVKIVPYLALGQLSRTNLLISAALLPVAILSTVAGVWLVRRIPPARFYTMIYWLLLLVGAKLIVDGVRAVTWST